MLSMCCVSLTELHFLLNFCEVAPLPWAEKPREMNKDEVLSCVSSLEEKQLLLKNEQGEYYLDDGLEYMLSIAGRASKVFVIEGTETLKEAVFFHGDAIVQIQQNRDQVEIMWLPVLPMLIGQIANNLSPFLNQEKNEPNLYPADQYNALLNQYMGQDYSVQWKFSAQTGLSAPIQNCTVVTDGKEQVMFNLCGEEVVVSKPDKSDFVNTLTKSLAMLHSCAIREGGILND